MVDLSPGALSKDPLVSKLIFSDSSWSIWFEPNIKSQNYDVKILTLFKVLGPGALKFYPRVSVPKEF